MTTEPSPGDPLLIRLAELLDILEPSSAPICEVPDCIHGASVAAAA